MEVNYQELTTQLWDLLTKEEIVEGAVSITYDCGISTDIHTGSSMVEKLLDKSPWRDHIIGFKRKSTGIDLVLDEEVNQSGKLKKMRYRDGVTSMDVINMEVRIKNNGEMIDTTIEMVDGVMVVSPKELFEPEDGDIVATKDGGHIFLCKDYIGEEYIYAYLGYDFNTDCWFKKDTWCASRYATEEEKKKFFDKLAEEGYEWNAEKKELVKLRWKLKYNEDYWCPSWLYSDGVVPFLAQWSNSKADNIYQSKGWVFKTKEECQEFCNRLNDAINSVKP